MARASRVIVAGSEHVGHPIKAVGRWQFSQLIQGPVASVFAVLEPGFEATGRLPHPFLTMYLVYVLWEVCHGAHVEVGGQLARASSLRPPFHF